MLAAVIGVLGRFAMREYLVSELEPTAAPKTIVGAPQPSHKKTSLLNAPAAAPASITRAEGTERQQVGARVTKATLSARAALTGATVQALVEQAIDEFLAKSA